MDDVRINLRLPRSQHEALKKEANREGVAVQALIRRGVTFLTNEPDTIHSHPPGRRVT